MSKYKIVTNGDKFRLMEWNWWWPFWCYVREYHSPSTSCIMEWEDEKKPQAWIDKVENDKAYENRPWVDL